MKYLTILICLFSVALVGQEETQSPEDFFKEVTGSKVKDKPTEDVSEVPTKVSSEEDIDLYRDIFINSIDNHLYLSFQGEKVSKRRATQMKVYPAIQINKSIVGLSSSVEEMNLTTKKDRIKDKIIFENYLTEKEVKVAGAKLSNPIYFKKGGKASPIHIGTINEDNSCLILYLSEGKYSSKAFSAEDLESKISSQLSDSGGGFILQISNEKKFKYKVVGIIEAGGSSILFSSSFVKDNKKL